MRELAFQRSQTVKEYVEKRGISKDRVFLQAPRTHNPETDWKPRAQVGIRGKG